MDNFSTFAGHHQIIMNFENLLGSAKLLWIILIITCSTHIKELLILFLVNINSMNNHRRIVFGYDDRIDPTTFSLPLLRHSMSWYYFILRHIKNMIGMVFNSSRFKEQSQQIFRFKFFGNPILGNSCTDFIPHQIFESKAY